MPQHSEIAGLGQLSTRWRTSCSGETLRLVKSESWAEVAGGKASPNTHKQGFQQHVAHGRLVQGGSGHLLPSPVTAGANPPGVPGPDQVVAMLLLAALESCAPWHVGDGGLRCHHGTGCRSHAGRCVCEPAHHDPRGASCRIVSTARGAGRTCRGAHAARGPHAAHGA